VRDPDIYVIAPDASGEREITFSRGTDADPIWSGDGSRLAFETNRNGNFDIYSVAADGSDAKQLTSSPQDELDPAWSADNGRIAFTVECGRGHDTLLGGSGNDCLFAQDGGRDTVDGGPGETTRSSTRRWTSSSASRSRTRKWPKKRSPC
jgi:Tol biopolymer transport system component